MWALEAVENFLCHEAHTVAEAGSWLYQRCQLCIADLRVSHASRWTITWHSLEAESDLFDTHTDLPQILTLRGDTSQPALSALAMTLYSQTGSCLA